MNQESNAPEQAVMDPNGLFREETYTDQRIGTIRRMTPVTAEGEEDSSRDAVFLGQTQVLTPGGAMPINFEIEADNLKEAVEKFPEAAQKGIEDTFAELEKMRQKQASSIVVPGADGNFGNPGGKIQMP